MGARGLFGVALLCFFLSSDLLSQSKQGNVAQMFATGVNGSASVCIKYFH